MKKIKLAIFYLGDLPSRLFPVLLSRGRFHLFFLFFILSLANAQTEAQEGWDFGGVTDFSLQATLEQARNGNINSMRALGEAYRSGLLEGGFDFKSSWDWYYQAALLGDPQSQLMVAQMRGEGLYVPNDEEDRLRWLRKSVENDFYEAKYYLGSWHLKQETLTSLIEGLELLFQSAAHPAGFLAKRRLSIFSGETLKSRPKNEQEQICEIFSKRYLSDKSSGPAIGLANCIDLGLATLPVAIKESDDLRIMAISLGNIFFLADEDFLEREEALINKVINDLADRAKSGDLNALMAITDCYLWGNRKSGHTLCKGDEQASFMWLTRANEEIGNPFYPFALARSYEKGIGTPRNEERAASIMEDLALKGQPNSMASRADAILSGAVNEELEKSFYWLNRAYQLNKRRYAGKLADYYFEGIGVDANLTKALSLYDSVVETDFNAAYKLARAFEFGFGTERNLARSLELYKRVAVADWWFESFSDRTLDERAKRSIPRVEKKLREEESSKTKNLGGQINFGEYHALVIGNADYQNLAGLNTPISDARLIKELLETQYGFQVTLLENATRQEIWDQIHGFRVRLRPSDNFLLYYAGHGTIDEELGDGYWQPIDARENNPANWIQTRRITQQIKAFSSRNAIVIADSCYSAEIFRGGASQAISKTSVKDLEVMRSLILAKSRLAISSGGFEPVPDSLSGGKNSIFASAFASLLRETKEPTGAAGIFPAIRDSVIATTASEGIQQEPQFSALYNYGHEGGDFIFRPLPSSYKPPI